jgi:hypothetical protein
LQDVALVQFQVATAVPPHAGAGPNDAEHTGGPLVPPQEIIAEALPAAPSAPTALMVQVSPAAPTVRGTEPAQSTAPLEGVVPVQTWVQDVASVQFQVTTAVPPHAGAGPNDAVQTGRARQVVEAEAMAVVPPLPEALMVQVSPAPPTVTGVEPVHGTVPLEGVLPVHT